MQRGSTYLLSGNNLSRLRKVSGMATCNSMLLLKICSVHVFKSATENVSVWLRNE